MATAKKKTPAKPARRSPRSVERAAGNPSPAAVDSTAPAAGNSLGVLEQAVAEKIKELVLLAQEQGSLTHNDVADAFTGRPLAPGLLDEVYQALQNLEVAVVDAAEIDRVRTKHDEAEERGRLDVLDDPVRMYLKQMGQVPLLNREQEVEISRRIENAENAITRVFYGFGFAGKEHIALAEKLLCEPPKERFDRVIIESLVEERDKHLARLRKLIPVARDLDRQADKKYAEWRACTGTRRRSQLLAAFRKLDAGLQRLFPLILVSSRRSSRK